MNRITNCEIRYLIGAPKSQDAETIFDTLAQIEAVFAGREGGKLPQPKAEQLAAIVKAHKPGPHSKLIKRIVARRQAARRAEWRNAQVSLANALAHVFTMTAHYRSSITNRKRKAITGPSVMP